MIKKSTTKQWQWSSKGLKMWNIETILKNVHCPFLIHFLQLLLFHLSSLSMSNNYTVRITRSMNMLKNKNNNTLIHKCRNLWTTISVLFYHPLSDATSFSTSSKNHKTKWQHCVLVNYNGPLTCYTRLHIIYFDNKQIKNF